MHRALQIAEIRALIIAELDSPSDLARLASTASCFTGLALDALYEEPSDFYIVFRTLPSDCWNIVSGGWNKHFILIRPITSNEIQRLESYLSRVKRISLYFNAERHDKDSLSKLFSQITLPLFPNLRKLTIWKIPTDSPSIGGLTFRCIMWSLLNERLGSLDLNFQDQRGTEVPDLLHDLPMFSPQLRSLKIQNQSKEMLHSVAQCLKNLPLLEELDVGWPHGWQTIASYPLIRILTITSDNFNVHAISPPAFQSVTTLCLRTKAIALDGDVSGPFFPSLGRLEAETKPSFFISMMNKLRASPLLSVKFESYEDYEIGVLRLVADALSAHSSLLNISLSGDGEVTADDLLPLKGLKRLKNLEVTIWDEGFFITNQDIGELIEAWPALESLELPSPASRISVECLTSFAKCPNLHTLRLACHIKGAHLPRSYNGIQNKSLVTLDLFSPDVTSGETCSLALFLSSLFPNLTSVEFNDDDDYYPGWYEVNAILRSIPNIREMERESLTRRGLLIQEGDNVLGTTG